MNPVPIVNVHAIIDISEDENHTGRRILCLCNNGVQSFRRGFNVLVLLHVFEQIKPELVTVQTALSGNTRNIELSLRL